MPAPLPELRETPPRGRRGSAEVRAALLDAAAELFARKGYGGTSTKEIAAAAKTSEATIYRHFGSKADLFSAAVVSPFSSFLADYQQYFQQTMNEDDWTDQSIVEQSVQRLYRYLRENRYAVLAMVSAHDDPESAQPAQQAIEGLDGFFEALHAIGVERWQRDPTGFDVSRLRIVHRLLVGMIFCVSALDRWFVPHEPHQPTEREIVAAITELLVRGLVEHAHGPAAGRADGAELLDQLERLGAMKDSGMLTDSEFSTAKTILLADSRRTGSQRRE